MLTIRMQLGETIWTREFADTPEAILGRPCTVQVYGDHQGRPLAQARLAPGTPEPSGEDLAGDGWSTLEYASPWPLARG